MQYPIQTQACLDVLHQARCLFLTKLGVVCAATLSHLFPLGLPWSTPMRPILEKKDKWVMDDDSFLQAANDLCKCPLTCWEFHAFLHLKASPEELSTSSGWSHQEMFHEHCKASDRSWRSRIDRMGDLWL